METWHQSLSQKYSWYAGWHQHPLHPHAHWGAFVVVAGLVTSGLLQIINASSASAASDPIGEAAAAVANGMVELGAGDYALVTQQTGPLTGTKIHQSLMVNGNIAFDGDVDKSIEVSVIAAEPGQHMYVPTNSEQVLIKNEFDNLTGNDQDGIPNAVSKRVQKTGTADVIVVMKLPFQRYFDKNDTATTRSGKHAQFVAAKNAITAAMGVGGHIKQDLPIINGLAITVNASALKGLAHNPNVQSIAPDLKVQAFLDQSTNTINAPSAWSLADTGGNALTGIGTRIAVIDTGVDYTRSDLGGCLGTGCKVEGGWDYVNNDANPMDDHGHGTHVAATAAGIGMVGTTQLYGVAPGAHILAYKVLNSAGSGSFSQIIAGINRAVDPNDDGSSADHVDVISMSLGAQCGTYSASCGPTDSAALAIDNASAVGVVSAISAGNSGPTASTIGSPGVAATAITVAAGCAPHGDLSATRCPSGNNTPIATFSSRGPVIYNGTDYKKPDITAPGVMICATRWASAFSTSPDCFDSGHVRISGTSMAAPHIAGVLALMKQANTSYTPADLKNLIKSSATDLGSGATYNDQGAGLVNVQKAIPIVSKISSSPNTWSFATDPTTKYSVKTQSFTITPKSSTLGTLTLGFTSSSAGITATFSKASVSLPSSATDSFSATVQVDNDVVKTGTYTATITFTDSTGKQVAAIPAFINVVPTITITPVGVLDYGVDAPNLTGWVSNPKVLTATNLRTDIPQTVTATPSSYPSGITYTMSAGSLSVPAGGNATLTTSFSVNNTSVANKLYTGTLAFSTGTFNTTLQTKFAKFYVLTIGDTSESAASFKAATIVYHNRALNSYWSAWTPLSNPHDMYLNNPGTYDVLVQYGSHSCTSLPCGYRRSLVMTEGVSLTSHSTITVSESQAKNVVTLKAIDINGNLYANTSNQINGFRHVFIQPVSAHWQFPLLASDKVFISDLSPNYSLHAYGQTYSSNVTPFYMFSWETTGLSGDLTLANTSADLTRVDFKDDLNLPDGTAIYPKMWYCVETSGMSCKAHGSGSVPTATLPFTQVTYSNYKLGSFFMQCAIALADYDGDVGSGGCWPSLYDDMHTYLSPFIDIGANMRGFLHPGGLTPLPGPVAGTIQYNGLGPAGFFEKITKSSFGTFEFNPVFFSKSSSGSSYGDKSHNILRQDYSAVGGYGASTYSIRQNGVTIYSGTYGNQELRSYCLISTGPNTHCFALPGPTEFIASFPYETKGVMLTGSVSSIFNTTLADSDPPYLTQLYYSTDGVRTDQYYTLGSENTVLIGMDPNSGTMQSLTMSYSTNGTTFTDVPVSPTSVSMGTGYTANIPGNVSGSILSVRFLGTDSSGNTLQYTFQLPISTATPPTGGTLPPPDTTAPTTYITSPANGDTVSAATTVTASASDNIGVARVDFFKDTDITAFASDTTSPYAGTLDTTKLTNAPHTLQTKAFDAAGNTGLSDTISVTVNNVVIPPTPPPTTSLSASPTSITTGQSSTLTYASTNATSCTGVNFTPINTSGSTTVFPTLTTTYSITCAGEGGTSPTASATVTVSSITPSFGINSRVKTTDNLNVRAKANTKSGKILCTQPKGALGTIVSGPSGAQKDTWWRVDFETSCDGWVTQTYLSL